MNPLTADGEAAGGGSGMVVAAAAPMDPAAAAAAAAAAMTAKIEAEKNMTPIEKAQAAAKAALAKAQAAANAKMGYAPTAGMAASGVLSPSAAGGANVDALAKAMAIAAAMNIQKKHGLGGAGEEAKHFSEKLVVRAGRSAGCSAGCSVRSVF
jgi:hypothetical protein